MSNIKASVLALCAFSTLSSVQAVDNDKLVNQMIGDKDIQLQVLSEAGLRAAALQKSIIGLNDPKAIELLNKLPQGKIQAQSIQRKDLKSKNIQKLLQKVQVEESLLVGFPLSLIGEQNIFGGVITKVSDKNSEDLGTLKLTDLPAIHTRTVITRGSDGIPTVTLVGCMNKCDEDSPQQAFLNFPIVGFNQEAGMLILDMSVIGKELDFISMIDPNGQYTQLKAISSSTTKVEYDLKTLIFDIETKMIPLAADPTQTDLKTTDFTVRWYLKLNSQSNPYFVPRAPRSEVGYFTNGNRDNITRFSTTGNGTGAGPVKYFIKNVPNEYKKPFKMALDAWNDEFTDLLGRKLISYEFVDQGDPRANELVAGDIRYNIIEWDLDNVAGYGGLGPSIASPATGETLSANILIQGPNVVKIYTKWFGVSQKANQLKELGKITEANKLVKEFHQSVQNDINTQKAKTFKLKLGQLLEMRVNSQRPELEDPIARADFDVVPAGMTYEKYMEGYFLEMVSHEMGHNLGLRHNFKGNLGAVGNGEAGSVSRSVMEYLGRTYRHINTIGAYDRMAIAYGYKGVIPKEKNWFCTDEDQGTTLASMKVKSPECTKSDATSDPFSYWESRMNRAIELALETKSTAAPAWTGAEASNYLLDAVVALSAYALSAEATASTWTNFFGKFDRPDDVTLIKPYVLKRLKKKLCNPELEEVISSKETPEGSRLAQENLDYLKATTQALTIKIGLYEATDFECK